MSSTKYQSSIVTGPKKSGKSTYLLQKVLEVACLQKHKSILVYDRIHCATRGNWKAIKGCDLIYTSLNDVLYQLNEQKEEALRHFQDPMTPSSSGHGEMIIVLELDGCEDNVEYFKLSQYFKQAKRYGMMFLVSKQFLSPSEGLEIPKDFAIKSLSASNNVTISALEDFIQSLKEKGQKNIAKDLFREQKLHSEPINNEVYLETSKLGAQEKYQQDVKKMDSYLVSQVEWPKDETIWSPNPNNLFNDCVM